LGESEETASDCKVAYSISEQSSHRFCDSTKCHIRMLRVASEVDVRLFRNLLMHIIWE